MIVYIDTKKQIRMCQDTTDDTIEDAQFMEDSFDIFFDEFCRPKYQITEILNNPIPINS